MTKPVNGPDFICIGMPKAGTRWLYDQLSHHPDFWMPPAKELHYLSQSTPKLNNSVRLLERWETVVQRRAQHGLSWGEPERAFLQDVTSCAGQPMDVGRYANLFRHKGSLLSGDISPGYCDIDRDVVGKIAAELPETKIVLLVREPIARVWSRICMAEREGKFDSSLLDDPDRFADFIKAKRYIHSRSFASETVRRWTSFYPADVGFRAILFDDIVRRPAETIGEILGFIGADPSKAGGLPPDHNRKASNRKLEMPERIRNLLIDYLSDEIRACATLLGGAARSWPSLYGL
jgi:hypothetical protein